MLELFAIMGKNKKSKSRKEPILASGVKIADHAGRQASWLRYAKHPLFHMVCVVLTGLLIYSNTYQVPFHFDDNHHIVDNPAVRSLGNFWPPSGARYVGMLSFAINYRINGLNVSGYHLVNNLIHILNAVLVYFLVILTFKTAKSIAHSAERQKQTAEILAQSARGIEQRTESQYSRFTNCDSQVAYVAFFSALLFVSHPIQTQAVTYIVQRFTSLATLFYLMSVLSYMKMRIAMIDKQRNFSQVIPWYLFSCVAALLAFRTKQIAYTLPVMLMLCEIVFSRMEGASSEKAKLFRRAAYLLPFFIIGLFLVYIDGFKTSGSFGEISDRLDDITRETRFLSRTSYLFTEFRVIMTYLRLFLLPVNQNLDYYDYPVFHTFFDFQVILSFLAILCLLGSAIYLFVKARALHPVLQAAAFGILWFFIALSVESSIIPIQDVIFEHRMYLPTVGLIFSSVAACSYIFANAGSRLSAQFSLRPAVGALLFVITFLSLSMATYQRNFLWQSEFTLWEDVLKKSPDNPRAYCYLGQVYKRKGYPDKAMELFGKALKISPDYYYVNLALALAYREKGDYANALTYYERVRTIKPDSAEVHMNIGNIHQKRGQTEKALTYYQYALAKSPENPVVHYNIGLLYLEQGKFDKAANHLEAAVKKKPDYPEAHLNLGNAYMDMGNYDKSIYHLREALKLKPGYTEAQYNLGLTYEQMGRLIDARTEYETVLRNRPGLKVAGDSIQRVDRKIDVEGKQGVR